MIIEATTVLPCRACEAPARHALTYANGQWECQTCGMIRKLAPVPVVDPEAAWTASEAESGEDFTARIVATVNARRRVLALRD